MGGAEQGSSGREGERKGRGREAGFGFCFFFLPGKETWKPNLPFALLCGTPPLLGIPLLRTKKSRFVSCGVSWGSPSCAPPYSRLPSGDPPLAHSVHQQFLSLSLYAVFLGDPLLVVCGPLHCPHQTAPNESGDPLTLTLHRTSSWTSSRVRSSTRTFVSSTP